MVSQYTSSDTVSTRLPENPALPKPQYLCEGNSALVLCAFNTGKCGITDRAAVNMTYNFPVSNFASLISCVRLNFYLELKGVCDVLAVKLGMTVLSNVKSSYFLKSNETVPKHAQPSLLIYSFPWFCAPWLSLGSSNFVPVFFVMWIYFPYMFKKNF